jgi:aminopeptidase Y
MCLPEDWNGIDAKGKIVLVKRGACAIYEKLVGARAAGAIGALLYHNEPGTNYTTATITAEFRDRVVPVGLIPLEVAQNYSSQLSAGEELKATLLVDSILEDRETWNIISETREGDPDNVVMLGAHLDSVPAGPGVNDDGSGTAGILEIMSALKGYKGFKNKVRFGWWGAEEYVYPFLPFPLVLGIGGSL